MVRWARNHKGTYIGMDKSAKLNPCLLIQSKFPMWEDNENIQTPKPGLLANVHEGSIFTGIKRLSWIVKPNHRFFMGSHTISILYLYIYITVQSCSKKSSKLGLFPSLGCRWDSGTPGGSWSNLSAPPFRSIAHLYGDEDWRPPPTSTWPSPLRAAATRAPQRYPVGTTDSWLTTLDKIWQNDVTICSPIQTEDMSKSCI